MTDLSSRTLETEPQLPRERAGVVVWIAIGLAVIGLLVGGVAWGLVEREESFDPSTLFATGVPPAPWNLASSERHASGTWIVRLEHAEEPAAAEPIEITMLVPKSRSTVKRWVEGWISDGTDQRYWGGGPSDDDTLESWREDPSEVEPFTRALLRKPITWGPWEAPATRVRTFEQDGSWTESVRVDLSQPPARHLVLIGQWPHELEADPEALQPLLERVAMLEQAD